MGSGAPGGEGRTRTTDAAGFGSTGVTAALMTGFVSESAGASEAQARSRRESGGLGGGWIAEASEPPARLRREQGSLRGDRRGSPLRSEERRVGKEWRDREVRAGR